MQTHVLRTSLRDEVKLADPGASESRGVRGWTAVEVPDKFWIHARRTDIGADGNLQVRQWVTADFHEAVRFSRGDGVISFSMFVGVFAPAAAASGVIFGEVSEVLHSAPSGKVATNFEVIKRYADAHDLAVWAALDDSDDGWPADSTFRSSLIRCDPQLGVRDPKVLKRLEATLRAGA